MRGLIPFMASAALVTVPVAPAVAQSSASYSITESTLNAGGHPRDGTTMGSASFRVTLDAVGAPLAGREMSSPSFRAEGGFVAAYPPPGPVSSVRWPDRQTLEWAPERSAGTYNVYRDLMSRLPAGGFGECLASGLTATRITDPALPPAGNGFFHLVTVENRLGEEGTKGWTSAGVERANATPCP